MHLADADRIYERQIFHANVHFVEGQCGEILKVELDLELDSLVNGAVADHTGPADEEPVLQVADLLTDARPASQWRASHQRRGLFETGRLVPPDGVVHQPPAEVDIEGLVRRDRKSTRLNSSHLGISYAVFC